MKDRPRSAERELRQRVSRNVARLRAERGLTFEMLSDRAGLHWRHLQKIEHGESNITLTTIARLSEGLSVDAQDLFLRLSPQR